MSERDALAADLRAIEGATYEKAAERLIALGWTRLDEKSEIARLRVGLETARLDLMQDVEPDAVIVGIESVLDGAAYRPDVEH